MLLMKGICNCCYRVEKHSYCTQIHSYNPTYCAKKKMTLVSMAFLDFLSLSHSKIRCKYKSHINLPTKYPRTSVELNFLKVLSKFVTIPILYSKYFHGTF